MFNPKDLLWAVPITIILMIVIIIGVFVLVYLAGEAIKRWARKPNKSFFAPVPAQEKFSFVVKEGLVVDVIENVSGWHIEKIGDDFFFMPGDREKGFWETTLGVRWIGPYTTIHVFKGWRWYELRQTDRTENGKRILQYELIPRGPEDIEEMLFQFSHPVVIDDAEIQGNIRINMTTLMTTNNMVPNRVFFKNKNAVDLFSAMVGSAIRLRVINMTFNESKAVTAERGSEIWRTIEFLNGLEFNQTGTPLYATADPNGIFGKIGQVVVRGEVLQIEAIGETAKNLEARRQEILKGDAQIAKAKKAAEVTVLNAQAKLDAATREALALRLINEQEAGYYASLPGGARMFSAAKVAGEKSSVNTWVEGKSDIDTALPLPIPPPPRPEEPPRVEETPDS